MGHQKQADFQQAKHMLYGVVDRKGLFEVQRVLKKANDQQSLDLLRHVQKEFIDRLDLDRSAQAALNRLADLASRGKGWDPALIRNNVFKVANSLGLNLPSAMFASQEDSMFDDTQLRKNLVRLAHANPDGIREHLLPLLRESGGKTAVRRDPKRMSPEEAMEMADFIMTQVGRKAMAAVEDANGEIYDQQRFIKNVEKAWKRWDWRDLESLGLVSRDDRQFVEEVQGMYSG